MAAQQFGGAGVEYQRLHGTPDEVFGMISVKERRHAANTPLEIFLEPICLDEVMASKRISGPLTRSQACLPTCGAAAANLLYLAFAEQAGPAPPEENVARQIPPNRGEKGN